MSRFFQMIIVGLFGLSLLITSASAFAYDPLAAGCRQGAQASSACQRNNSGNPLFGPTGIITRATEILTTVVGIAAVIMVMIGGFKYIMSSGDSSSVESAKNTILFAVIGLVIALAARTIVIFVLRKL